jgi:hypothetical protein
VNRIRKLSKFIDDSNFGFGLKLWDKFYNQPKYRGLHIYNTKLLEHALKYIPDHGEQLRPESFVKQKMLQQGYVWHNDISKYVAGIHDFYQKPQDIYYKFLIRSKRSVNDIDRLKSIFKSNLYEEDYKIALKGLEDGLKMDTIINDKYQYSLNEFLINTSVCNLNHKSSFIDSIVIIKLLQRYKLGLTFWYSL